MKVRIKPVRSIAFELKYELQYKRWWGWKTLGDSFHLKQCLMWIEELKEIADVEFIRYV